MKLPQLSLRELFLLVALAAMGCGWWVERRSLILTAADSKRNADRFERLYSGTRRALERDGYEVLEWGPDNDSLSIHPKPAASSN